MFHHLTESITGLLHTYGILGVFLASILEEIIAPIPSAGVVLLAGVLLIPADATFVEAARHAALSVMLPASLGITLGSLFPYYVARIGGEVAVNKCGRLLGVDWAQVKKAERYFAGHKSDEILLFAVRCVPVIPSVIIGVFCGLVRVPVREFLFYSFLGSLIRTFILAMIGWAARSTYQTYVETIGRVEDIVLVATGLILIGVAVWWIRRQRKRGKQ
jgi:membrane protein DedA with SNARE-associated domain